MNEWQEHFLKVIETCRANNHDLRLGQMLFNALAMHDGRAPGYDEDFHSRLFYVEDEELATILTEWFEWVEQQAATNTRI